MHGRTTDRPADISLPPSAGVELPPSASVELPLSDGPSLDGDRIMLSPSAAEVAAALVAKRLGPDAPALRLADPAHVLDGALDTASRPDAAETRPYAVVFGSAATGPLTPDAFERALEDGFLPRDPSLAAAAAKLPDCFRALAALPDEGCAVVPVLAPALFSESARPARRRLLENELVESVVLLPRPCFVNPNIPGALLVLQRGSRTVGLYDLSDCTLRPTGSKLPARDRFDVQAAVGRLAHGQATALKDARDLAEGDSRLDVDSFTLPSPPRYAHTLEDLGFRVFAGVNTAVGNRRFETSADSSLPYRLVSCHDFPHGALAAEGGSYFAPQPWVSERDLIRPQDILIPKSGTALQAVLVLDRPLGQPDHPGLVPSSNVVVLRCKHDGYGADFPAFVAAFLNGDFGIRRIVEGVTMRHVSLKKLRQLRVPLPDAPTICRIGGAWRRDLEHLASLDQMVPVLEASLERSSADAGLCLDATP